MLFVMVVINYLDRSNLSVAAPGLSRDLQLDPFYKGLLLSAFGWAYAALQIPGGWLVDRVRPRILFAAACGLWSLATLLQGFAGAFLIFFLLRLLVGIFEAPAYPVCNRLVTTWFPEKERAGAIGCYTSGQFVGLAFLTPVLALAQKNFGWHSVFIFTGAAGLLWAALWYWRYRDPFRVAQRQRSGAANHSGGRRSGGFECRKRKRCAGRIPMERPGGGSVPSQSSGAFTSVKAR